MSAKTLRKSIQRRKTKLRIASLQTWLWKPGCSSFAFSCLDQGKKKASQTPRPSSSCCFSFFFRKQRPGQYLTQRSTSRTELRRKNWLAAFFFKKALQWPPTAWDHLIKRRRRKKISYHYFHFTGGKIKICGYYCLSLRASWSIHKGHKNSCWTKFMCESVYKKKCIGEYSAIGINMDSKEITFSENKEPNKNRNYDLKLEHSISTANF